MKNQILFPQDQVFWYLNKKTSPALSSNLETDIIVVGGGMAGLHAAQAFHTQGYKVTLLEKSYCGAGASGKSSGFITPESELNVTHLLNLFGFDGAKKLWDLTVYGCTLIENNIKNFNLDCDYKVQNTLVVASSDNDFKELEIEHNNRTKLGYKTKLYSKTELTQVLGSHKYFGGLESYDTFGVSGYKYCQQLKTHLESIGVQVFEDSCVVKINQDSVETSQYKVTAKYIIVCVDRFLPEFNKFPKDVYCAQTFLMLSEPLSKETIEQIFPKEQLMVWDTDFIYQYFRIIEDNRLMVGGSDLISIFWGREQHNQKRIIKHLDKYIKNKFPQLKINFEFFWPGLIGVSKDLAPVAGPDTKYSNIYYISGATGLPWAAAIGNYSAQRLKQIDNTLEKYLSFNRKFAVNRVAQTFLGKRISFALSNFISMYFKK
ncbi:MAG: FAD-dependent oxidoreductase [Candidatus Babeliales bacterium]|nr:FAD-dependent oxidoreductase [Candidatus Babeliales bacterium]